MPAHLRRRQGSGRGIRGRPGPALRGTRTCGPHTKDAAAGRCPRPRARALASYAAKMAEALRSSRCPRRGPARCRPRSPSRSSPPPASGAAGLRPPSARPPPSPRPPGGHPLTCSRARRALGLRQVPKQVHGGGGIGTRAAREQRRAPHPAAAGSTPGGGVSDGMAGPRRRQSTEGGPRTPPIGARRGPAAPEFRARARRARALAARPWAGGVEAAVACFSRCPGVDPSGSPTADFKKAGAERNA